MELVVQRGDITTVAVDAVVNAANSSLLGGGGVDGAIHRVGGPDILTATKKLRDTDLPAGLPTGDAVATTAGKLPARWVIHTVGPVYAKTIDRSHLLVSCYQRALEVADELGARSVAFPTISAGVYGWPSHDAVAVAVHTVRQQATALASVEKVIFVPFSKDMERLYHQQLAV